MAVTKQPMTFKTKSGIELKLQPVGELALMKYFMDIGGVELANDTSQLGDFVKGLSPVEQVSFIENMSGLLSYVCGFGIDHKLTDEDHSTLKHIGKDDKNDIVALSNWVWLVACRGDGQNLIQLMMEVTNISKGSDNGDREAGA